ncbi:MAG: hypothetical protein HKO93_01220, partial [Flavobacteriales bacterium]|nr:hypothetical protein [Flavobacteriales bacterium]
MRRLILFSLLLTVNASMAFEVVETSPARNIITAEPTAAISIVFNESVDISSLVQTGDVSVFGRWSGPADIDITVGGFGNTLYINPSEPFFAGEYVMVNLSADVASLQGETLGHGYSYGFWIRTLPGSMDLVEGEQLEVRLEGETFIQCYGAYAGDLDNDGWGDLTVVNENSEDLRVFMSNGGSFSEFTLFDLPIGNKPSSNEGADLNMDGEIDLVIGNTQGNMVSVVMGNGDGSFGDEVIYEAAQGVRGVTILDMDGDGDMDIVTANRQGSNISFFINDGTGQFTDGGSMDAGVNAETAIIAADMDNDGITDLVVGGYVSDEISVLLNDGEGNFAVEDVVDTGDGPWMITMGDVNGDGNIDIASANSGADLISIHLGDGAGGLAAPDNMFTGGFPLAIDFGDLDGDGDLDVISSNYSGGDFTLYENLGTGEFDNERTLQAEIAGSCAIFHDRNNDGVMDITGIDELADVLIFFENQSVGLDERREETFMVSPNPFSGSFTLNLGPQHGLEVIHLMDVNGRRVDIKKVQAGEQSIFW